MNKVTKIFLYNQSYEVNITTVLILLEKTMLGWIVVFDIEVDTTTSSWIGFNNI